MNEIELYDTTPFDNIVKKYKDKINIHFLSALEGDMYYWHGVSATNFDDFDMVLILEDYNLGLETCATVKNRFGKLQKYKSLEQLCDYLNSFYK